MRFTLFLLIFFSQRILFSQVLQGFSGSEALGSAQNVLGAHSATNLFLQPAVPLEKCGFYSSFSSVLPAISGIYSDFQGIFVKQNPSSSYRIGLVQSNAASLKRQILLLGLSKKIIPEFFMGIDLIYVHSGIPEYETKRFPGSQFSFFYSINPKLQVASNLGIIKSSIESKRISDYYHLNLSWQILPQLKAMVMSKKEADAQQSDQSFAFQFQKPNSYTYINTGCFLNRPEFSFGTGFRHHKLDFNFSSSWRLYWGLRFSCSIQYFLEDRK